MSESFWLKNPKNGVFEYGISLCGELYSINLERRNKEQKMSESVWLNYKEIEGISNLKLKEEKYYLCEKMFNEKFPQPKEKQIELSKEEQSKLEKLFP